jgi:hypothetical protein
MSHSFRNQQLRALSADNGESYHLTDIGIRRSRQ